MAILIKELDGNINLGLIGFSWFPRRGSIVQEVLQGLGLEDILVREFSC